MDRRRFIISAVSLLCAPTIVRVASLMPVRAPKLVAVPGPIRVAIVPIGEKWDARLNEVMTMTLQEWADLAISRRTNAPHPGHYPVILPWSV